MRETPPLIDTRRGLETLLRKLEAAPVVGVDAEMDSFYSYREKICLIQFSTGEGDYLLDPLADLDLEDLGQVFADAGTTVVFHAGENDIPYFRRQYGFRFDSLFDTYLAARVLGYPQCGLASLLQQHFGVELDKRFQMADWRVRPLPEDMADYARTDTRYLLELREILTRELAEAGRLEEAHSEFQRAARASGSERRFDPNGWARLKAARRLPPRANGALRSLYHWREEEARRRDVPVFRVLPDALMVALAARPPASATDLRRSVKHAGARACADAILEALREGERHGPVSAPRPRKPGFEPLPPEQEAAFQRLRDWRNRRSGERGVEPDRVGSNRLLRQVVLARPSTLDDLEKQAGLEPWRVAEYGREILEVLNQAG